MRKGVRIAVAALALALPQAARAESVSYVEGGNVFIATPDGARRVQITTSGTNDSPYTLAGTADSGKTQTSYGSPSTWFSFNPDGTSTGEQPNLVPMRQCGAAFGSIGPIAPRLDPSGDMVVFNYFCNGPISNPTITNYLQVDLPKYYTSSTNAQPVGSDLNFGSFFGKRLIVEDTNILIQDDDPNNPFTTNFSDWVLPDPGEDLTRAEVARGGGRMVIDETLNGTKQIIIGTFANIFEFTTVCTLAAGAPSEGTFSPDGTKLAWTDSAGVRVGQLDLARSDCIVPGSVKTLSATGSSPRWSAYTVPEPVQNQTPSNPNGTTNPQQPQQQTTGPPAPTVTVAVAATAKLKQLVKGLVVGYDVNTAGVIASALTMPAKQAKKLGVARVSAAQVRVAFARKTVAAAGKGKLTLKLTKKAKKRAKKLKGRTLTLRTIFTPKAGTPVVTVKKLRIR
jgi:hypothetical protein